MSKLKCVPHRRRVMVFRASKKVIHRADGSRCDAEKLELKGRMLRPGEVGASAGAD